MSQENVEAARRAVAALNGRDLEALSPLLTRDCEIVSIRAAVDDTVFRGPDAAAEWFAAHDEAWLSLAADVETYRHGDDWVLALGHMRAHGRSSGAMLDQPAAAIFRFRDGRIARCRIYTELERALADLGLKE